MKTNTKNPEAKNIETLPEKETTFENGTIPTHRYAISMTDSKFELVRQKNSRKGCKKKHSETMLMALLPENLREIFQASIYKAFPGLSSNESSSVVIYGNLCPESIVFNYIDSLKSAEDLPDIIISYDFNKFYHNNFSQKFLNPQYFEPVCFPTHPAFTEMSGPHGCMGIIAVDPWVIVVDKTKFEYKPTPREWYELLNPALHKSIIISGGNDYFNRSVFLPFIRNYGTDVVKRLSDNILNEAHPSLITNLIQDGIEIGASVFVMPYSYASQIQDCPNFQIIWPEDGAMAIPIQLMIKKGAYEKHRKLIDFLSGPRLAKVLEQQGYQSVRPEMPDKSAAHNLNWIGWDFIAASNIGKLKDYINQCMSGQ